MSTSLWWRVGSLSAASAVGFGAFGAHGLKQRVTDERMLSAFHTAANYHLLHSFALMLCPLVQPPYSSVAGALFSAGILLFSGSLYGMATTENRKLGAITPIGGLCFIGGWLALACGKTSFVRMAKF